MSEQTFLWHDYETFGANPRLDRPAQFAAIRTDADFEPIEDPVVLWCAPTLDVLPQPAACLITGITPQTCAERGDPEPLFIAAVLSELGRPGTCGVGYNSMRFDDEVTRHTAWRNFHDPYAREWRDGCSRWDLIDAVRLAYALRPDGITWPTRDDGAPSFRLEELAAANALVHEQAHDALSDVRATIALARLLRERQPRLLEFVLAHRDKHSARSLLALGSGEPVVHVSARFPASQGCLSLVLPIAEHPVNRNAVLCVDLRHPPDDLLELPAEDIADRLFTPSADLPEDVERVHVKAVHVNRAPVLAPLKTLRPQQAERLGLDLARCRRHAEQLMAQRELVADKLVAAHAAGDLPDSTDPEQNLYGGFLSDADRALCDRITRMGPDELATFRPRFEDPRLPELYLRYRGRHYPDSLDADEREDFDQWQRRRILHAPDGGLDLASFEAEVAARTAGATEPRDLRVLADLAEWAERLRRIVG